MLRSPGESTALGIAVTLALISVAVFLPALGFDAVNLDDENYLLRNPNLSLPFWKYTSWALSTFRMSNWHPATWISYWFDHEIWGLDPRGFHLTNIALHALNVFLVTILTWRLLRLDTPTSRSGTHVSALFVGLVFAVHPLQVESVAWIAERKNLVFAFFWLIGLLQYLRYTTEDNCTKARLRYLACLSFFVLSLAAKPMAVTFPLVLVILDFHPLKRFQQHYPSKRDLLIEKIPFIIASLVTGVITLAAQSSEGSAIGTGLDTLLSRLVMSIQALGFYLLAMVRPLDLYPIYPREASAALLSWELIASSLAIAAITWLALSFRNRKPWLAMGWLWFLVMMLPTLGIIQYGYQFAADRNMYLSMLGLLLILTGITARKLESGTQEPRYSHLWIVARFLGIVLVGGLLAILTQRQLPIWHDSFSLWNYELQRYPAFSAGWSGRAKAHLDAGSYSSAVNDFTRAIEIDSDPDSVTAARLFRHYANRGNAWYAMHDYEAALRDFSSAIAASPSTALNFFNRALAHTARGDLSAAIADSSQAVRLDPELTRAHIKLGILFLETGELTSAAASLSTAIALDPQNAESFFIRGLVAERKGDLAEAEMDFRTALKLGDQRAAMKLRESTRQ